MPQPVVFTTAGTSTPESHLLAAVFTQHVYAEPGVQSRMSAISSASAGSMSRKRMPPHITTGVASGKDARFGARNRRVGPSPSFV